MPGRMSGGSWLAPAVGMWLAAVLPCLVPADSNSEPLEASAPGSPTTEWDERAVARIEAPPLGLPPVPVPGDALPTAAEVRLGRALFFDRRLSRDGNMSCAMCHIPEQGFGNNELRTAVGIEGKSLPRNAPTLFNVAYAGPFFRDGREPELELQPFDVFLNPDEMAAASLGALVEKVRSLSDYTPMFRDAFGGSATVTRIGQAVASYERSLLAANSAFDRWYFGGETNAMTPAAKRGFRLFIGEANCAACHTIDQGSALFTDRTFHDTGLGWHRSMVERKATSPVRVEIAPGRHVEVARAAVESVGDPPTNDLGRYEVTGDPAHRWQFKTPSLRNVALTGPYMHDGSLLTLRQVVEFYNQGGFPHASIDPEIEPLDLGEREISDLVAFLQSLTGDNVDELIRDARSQRVGNVGEQRH